MSAVYSGNLCLPCSSFDVQAALLHGSRSEVLEIRPFREPIDETTCELCQVARHAVGYQDGHEKHKIRIKGAHVGSLVVERIQDGLFRRAGYLNSSADQEKYSMMMEDYDDQSTECTATYASNGTQRLLWRGTPHTTRAWRSYRLFLGYKHAPPTIHARSGVLRHYRDYLMLFLLT